MRPLATFQRFDPAENRWTGLSRLPEPVSAYMLYPNFRGMMFDDQSRTLRFEVAASKPSAVATMRLNSVGRRGRLFFG